MFFLIRTAFWFSLVLLFLPIRPGSQGSDQRVVGPIEAFSAAQRTIGDLSRFCEREPDVCETGQAAAETIGVRAKESARMAGDMLETYNNSQASGPESIIDLINQGDYAPTPPTAILPTPRPQM